MGGRLVSECPDASHEPFTVSRVRLVLVLTLARDVLKIPTRFRPPAISTKVASSCASRPMLSARAKRCSSDSPPDGSAGLGARRQRHHKTALLIRSSAAIVAAKPMNNSGTNPATPQADDHDHYRSYQQRRHSHHTQQRLEVANTRE